MAGDPFDVVVDQRGNVDRRRHDLQQNLQDGRRESALGQRFLPGERVHGNRPAEDVREYGDDVPQPRRLRAGQYDHPAAVPVAGEQVGGHLGDVVGVDGRDLRVRVGDAQPALLADPWRPVADRVRGQPARVQHRVAQAGTCDGVLHRPVRDPDGTVVLTRLVRGGGRQQHHVPDLPRGRQEVVDVAAGRVQEHRVDVPQRLGGVEGVGEVQPHIRGAVPGRAADVVPGRGERRDDAAADVAVGAGDEDRHVVPFRR
jgi:hypothetical protein